jgi:hypothetical protein
MNKDAGFSIFSQRAALVPSAKNAQFQKAELRDAPILDRKRTQRSQREELGFARNGRSQPRNLFGVPALAGSGWNSKLSLPQKSTKDAARRSRNQTETPSTQRRRGRREPQSFFFNHGWTRIPQSGTDKGEMRISRINRIQLAIIRAIRVKHCAPLFPIRVNPCPSVVKNLFRKERCHEIALQKISCTNLRQLASFASKLFFIPEGTSVS